MRYLMESDTEAERLRIKTDREQTRLQLLDSGWKDLKPGSKVVDAGCGAGVVSEVMATLSKELKQDIELLLVDGSLKRIEEAKKTLKNISNKTSFICSELSEIRIPDNSVDLVYCRFVFEYLSNPEAVFKDFLRILKPGGKLVIGDLDNNNLTHYPISKELELQLQAAVAAITETGTWDPQAGRKLYSLFYNQELENINVKLYPHHFLFGKIHDRDLHNWEAKILKLEELQEKGEIQLDFNVKDFGKNFLALIQSPGRFSYTPLIIVEGTKPL